MAVIERKPAGGRRNFRIFLIIWVGQLVSLLGSGMTAFALPIWVFQQTGQATQLTTMGGLFVAFLLLATPFAGMLVDRGNRKLMMIISDLASGVITIFIFFLFATGRLEIWHLYITNALMGAFNAFQWPAFSAAISVMLNKDDYTRASSLLEVAQVASNIIAPVAAGAILGLVGGQNNLDQALQFIFLIDIVTFLFAVGTLLFINVPEPERTAAQEEAEAGGFWSEVGFGWRYIVARPSLLGLQLVFLLGNLLVGVSFALLAPMILARTGSDEFFFGIMQMVAGVGGIVGGVIVSAWGGFKRRVHGVLLGWAIGGVFGTTLMAFGRYEPVWMRGFWLAAVVISMGLIPLINGSNQAIWQSKVPPDIQGKVFSMRRLIAWLASPLSWFVAGPLADQLLEPAMMTGGTLTGLFGPLIGTGPGAGMALTYLFTGVLSTVVGLGGYLVPAIRNAEDLLPDHDQVGEVEAGTVLDEVEGAESSEAPSPAK